MSAPGQDAPDTTQVMMTLLRAIEICTQNAMTDNSGAEAKDFAAAVKSLSDAYVVLDPAMDGSGVPLGHQMELESLKAFHEDRRREAEARREEPGNERTKARS